MNSQSIEQFIQDNKLTAISYLNAKHSEIVHPRVRRVGGQIFVYGRTGADSTKRPIEIGEFMRLLAQGIGGLAVAGNLGGGAGPQTSISFSQVDRLTIAPAFSLFVERWR